MGEMPSGQSLFANLALAVYDIEVDSETIDRAWSKTFAPGRGFGAHHV